MRNATGREDIFHVVIIARNYLEVTYTVIWKYRDITVTNEHFERLTRIGNT